MSAYASNSNKQNSNVFLQLEDEVPNSSINSPEEEKVTYISQTKTTATETDTKETPTSSSQQNLDQDSNQEVNEALSEIIVDAIAEANDLTVLESQLTPEELVTDLDIVNTESLIDESRILEAEDKEELEYENINDNTGSIVQINVWDIFKKSAINLVLPFINGMMLGFGEILAHEIGFRYKWFGARVEPVRRMLPQYQQRKAEQSVANRIL